MRVVVVCDRFGPDTGAGVAAARLGQGWRHQAPHDLVETWALSDGGPGFADAVADVYGRQTMPVVVAGPSGGEVPAQLVVLQRDGARTAYLDASHAAGRHLVDDAARPTPKASVAPGGGLLLRPVTPVPTASSWGWATSPAMTADWVCCGRSEPVTTSRAWPRCALSGAGCPWCWPRP